VVFNKKTKDQKFKVSKHPSNPPSFSLSLKPVFLSFFLSACNANHAASLISPSVAHLSFSSRLFSFFQPDHDRLPAQPSLAKTTSSRPTSLLPSLTHRHPGPTCQSFPLPPTDNMANRTATHPQPPPLFPSLHRALHQYVGAHSPHRPSSTATAAPPAPPSHNGH
jgi:hypothetical protein